jgi:hypothetical protein
MSQKIRKIGQFFGNCEKDVKKKNLKIEELFYVFIIYSEIQK